MDGNEEIFARLMGDGEFRKLAMEHLLGKVYRAFNRPPRDRSQE
jgi:type I restriction enzyme R subunit